MKLNFDYWKNLLSFKGQISGPAAADVYWEAGQEGSAPGAGGGEHGGRGRQREGN